MLLAGWLWAAACPPFLTGGGVAADVLSFDFEVLKIKHLKLESDSKVPRSAAHTQADVVNCAIVLTLKCFHKLLLFPHRPTTATAPQISAKSALSKPV